MLRTGVLAPFVPADKPDPPPFSIHMAANLPPDFDSQAGAGTQEEPVDPETCPRSGSTATTFRVCTYQHLPADR